MTTFIGKKRSRSKSMSKESETSGAIPENLLKHVFDTSSKKTCSFCDRDITRLVKIVCTSCPDIIFCLDCLINGKSAEKHAKHDYHIIDELNFHLFTNDWSTEEELQLLTGKLF
jgi:hypothetical protein